MILRDRFPLVVMAVAVGGLLPMHASLFARKAAAEASAVPEFDRTTVVILAPGGPVIADLRITVAKVPYRTWVGRFLAANLDVNGDSRLDAEELSLITENVRAMTGISGPEQILKEIHPAAAGEDVGASEFALWLRSRIPKVFDLIAHPLAADEAVRLTSLLDADQNAAISEVELLAALKTMRFRDLDNDETFSVAELLPYRDPRSQNVAVTPDVVELPFFEVTEAQSATIAAETILRRYGKDGRLTAQTLRLNETALDPDTSMDSSVIHELLLNPTFHLQVDVRLSDRANTSDIDITVAPCAADFCQITDDTFGQSTLNIDGMVLKIVARGGGANNRAVTRGFLGQTFVMLDMDRNQYLDEAEFAGMIEPLRQTGSTGSFTSVDLNRDGMINRDELFAFVQRDQIAAVSRIEMTVRQDGKTLFSLLDRNHDRRLSVREMRSGFDVLQQYDFNGDGDFAETELGTEYLLTLGLGRSELRRTNAAAMPLMNPLGRNDAILPGVSGLSGPEWFRRMDRNQDGDVSRREFLGSAGQFRSIDANQDELISVSEAESAN